jgi:hypothetical protein
LDLDLLMYHGALNEVAQGLHHRVMNRAASLWAGKGEHECHFLRTSFALMRPPELIEIARIDASIQPEMIVLGAGKWDSLLGSPRSN